MLNITKIRQLYFASVSFRGFGSAKQPKRISFQDFLISITSQKSQENRKRQNIVPRLQNEVFERLRLQREITTIVKHGKKTVKLGKVPFLPKLKTSRPRLTALLNIALFDNII